MEHKTGSESEEWIRKLYQNQKKEQKTGSELEEWIRIRRMEQKTGSESEEWIRKLDQNQKNGTENWIRIRRVDQKLDQRTIRSVEWTQLNKSRWPGLLLIGDI